MATAKRDDNNIPTILAVSNADSTTPVVIEADPTTKRLLVDVVGGTGTSSTDDSVFTAGTGSGTPAMGFFSTDTVDSGDVGVLAMDASRRLLVSIEADNAGIGGGIQYAEDSAHVSGNTGTLALVVRKDTPTNLSDTDGDYEALQVSGGRLWASTLITGDALTALQLIDDTVYSEDVATPATIVGNAILVERDDVLSTVTPVEGDWVGLRASAEGALWVQEFNSDAILADTANMDTNLGIIAGAVSGSEMQVDVLTLPNVTLAAGTNTNEVVGDVADDAVSAGNPVLIGGVAIETDGTDPGKVSAEADMAFMRTDLNRRLLVNTAHPNLWSAVDNQSTAQTNKVLKTAPGANLSLYITDVIVSNGATAGNIKFVEDTAGTPVDKIEVMYFAANGGAVMNFKTPIRITANKDFGYTSVTVTTHSITVNGYIAP